MRKLMGEEKYKETNKESARRTVALLAKYITDTP